MRVSREWLSTLVDLPTSDELVARFIETGTEVEAVDTVGMNLHHVVTAQNISKKPHPDSDHMYVNLIDVGMNNVGKDGKPEPLQIVCGAQNYNEGDHIAVSMIGAELPNGMTIKKSKLRGVTSYGMCCSEIEIGVGPEGDGIMILPTDAPIGMPLAEYLGLSDKVYDCEITPNRPDCLSMIGMAREVGAMLGEDTHIELPVLTESKSAKTSDLVDVEIAEPARCARYTARVIKGVKVGPSPEWLVKRITAAGQRCVNNVVDITNYIMFLTGQPLHAFDLNTFEKKDGKVRVVVRGAQDGEKLTTLDGVERELTQDMTVITDGGSKAVALAGVMGGLATEVTDETVDILLESATFASAYTSRTSRNLSLFSEASMRYERGVDANMNAEYCDVAAAIFADVCGGEVACGIVDQYVSPVEPIALQLRCERFRRFVGAEITNEEAIDFLTRLGCSVSVNGDDENVLDVIAPTFRPDLEREVDLYEEVLRLWGMSRVTPTLPAAKNHTGGLTRAQRIRRTIGQVIRASNMNETVTYAFVPKDDLERLGMTEEGRGSVVELINPMSEDMSVMRRSIVPGLLRSVAYNQAHGVSNISLYEMATVFAGRSGNKQPREKMMVAGVMSGDRIEAAWNVRAQPVDFFDGKGVIENVLRELCVEKVRFREAKGDNFAFLQPGRAAEVMSGGAVLGWVGEIHPARLGDFEIDGAVVAFELDVAALIKNARDQREFNDVPTFPAVSADLAVIVKEDVTNERLMQVITSAGGKLLESVKLFDVFRDPEHVGEGMKSMGYRVTYRANDRTLTSEEVSSTHERVMKKACKATGGEVRGM